MAKKSMKSFEKEWMVQEDARTLARYQEIMNDSKRRAAAIKQAKTEADNLTKQANMMRKAYKGN